MYALMLSGLSLEEVRRYEQTMQEKTNTKVKSSHNTGEGAASHLHCNEIAQGMGVEGEITQMHDRAVEAEKEREKEGKTGIGMRSR